MAKILDGIKNAWNAFIRGDPPEATIAYGYGYSYRPDRNSLSGEKAKSLVAAIYTRISIDAAAITMEHVRLDENQRFKESIDSPFNNCLKVEANLDQGARAFRQDMCMSMLDEGVIAVVPIITVGDPRYSESFKVYNMRVGKILEWYPSHVKVRVYNEQTGRREDIRLPKWAVAIMENPLYPVMNEPNSTLKRLIRKLNLLDYVDEQSTKNKLDLIIQLPYALKTDSQKKAAKRRLDDIETQLTGSTYGIAYIDSTEHITQLNRPVENNLASQVKELTEMLYGELGITKAVMDGTASEQEMLNYYNRTLEPILTVWAEEFIRKFLSKTARSQNQSVLFFRDSFRLVPVGQLADIADKFTRNEILTSNEMRSIIGYKPSSDPRADELRNKNLNKGSNEEVQPVNEDDQEEEIEET